MTRFKILILTLIFICPISLQAIAAPPPPGAPSKTSQSTRSWALAGPTTAEMYQKSDLVFLGTAHKRVNNQEYIFHIEQTYKGRHRTDITVLTFSRPNIRIKDKYLVYIQETDGFHITSKRSLIHDESITQDTIQLLTRLPHRLKEIDLALLQETHDIDFLKTAAEELISWKDQDRTLKVLRLLHNHAPQQEWALTQLLNQLETQRKAPEIWYLYTQSNHPNVSWSNELYAQAISYASIALNKDIDHPLILKNKNFQDVKKIEGGRDYVKLRRISFQYSDLQSSNFSHSKLDRLTLHHTNLSHANFKGSKLMHLKISEEVDLSGTNFEGAKISSSYLQNANLKDANFKNAQLTHSYLHGTNFEQANLTGVSLTGSKYDCTTKWPKGFAPEAAGAYNTEKKPCK